MEAEVARPGVEAVGGVVTPMTVCRPEVAMRLLKLLLVLIVCAAGPAPAILIIVGIQAGQIGGVMHVSPSWKA